MKKIAIIGAGNVGAHVAAAAIHKNLTAEILLVDENEKFENSQVLDLRDALNFFPAAKISGADFGEKKLRDADIFVITAGAKQAPGETRIDLLEKNILILKKIASQIGKIKSSAIVILVTNPVDILTHAAQKIFDLPRAQIFGSGTVLDSARLRWRLADFFKKNISEISGFVLGEHGDSEFVAWSTVKNSEKIPAEKKIEIETAVRRAAYEIIAGKGATFFGIGAAAAEILAAILRDEKKILPISAILRGEFSIEKMAVGVPCVVGKSGVEKISEIFLPAVEKKLLQNSAKKLQKIWQNFENKI